ncbi:MAG TPA: MFS transporter [Methanospirillum sp.]|uniref:MFS transporter n=1 Tax=Methanospirillum sp. TaxID=45200 RepID=UPI002C61599E|nr:MFS transporter [Methanospirillum sp.]HWQ64970.1 MFS transporter [Methanospirillum sp.]
MQVNQESEKRIIGLIRLHIIPFALLLYIVAFLDRVNLGYAAIVMNPDLGISAELFGFISGIFFIGYLIFEVPSNIIMQKVGARIWIGRIMISWGLVAVLMGFVQSPEHLIVLRFLLGIAEAGFFPGMIWYLGTWFPHRYLARSIALFSTAIVISNIIGAPLSMYILDMVNWGSIAAWRWLFIIEGIPAILFGLLSLLILKNRPADAGWLDSDQKQWLILELESGTVKIHPHRLVDILTDTKVLLFSGTYFAVTVGMYAIIFFLPTLSSSFLHNLDMRAIGLILMIPYIVTLICMFLVSCHSDLKGERLYHIVILFFIAGAGLTLDQLAEDPILSLLGITIALSGILSIIGPFWSYVLSQLTPDEQPVGVAVINSIGNLGGFVGPVITGYLISLFKTLDSGWPVITFILCLGAVMIFMAGKMRTPA